MNLFFNKRIALFWIGGFLLSCSNNNDNDTSSKNRNGTTFTPLSEYLQDMSVLKGEGTILLQSNEGEFTQHKESSIHISQMPATNMDALILYDANGDSVNITECDSDLKCKRNLYGSVLNFQMNGKKDQLYIPELIKMDFRKDVIEEGSVVQWNSDPNNSRGVVVWISYEPLYQLNLELLAEYSKAINHAVATDDSGSYTITKKDLEKFPKNSFLELTLLRTNYVINERDKPSLIAFTQVYKKVDYLSK